MPRWLILLLDVCIVLLSSILTYFLFKGLRLSYVPDNSLSFALVFYLLINVFFFWLYRTYSGIIRHSSLIDALKLFFSQLSTFIALLVFNFIVIVFSNSKVYLTTGAFINAVLSFSFLFFYRLVVKQIFDRMFTSTTDEHRISAIIYGSDANAIAVANALLSERPGRFKLYGFIDKDNQNFTKRILNLPIFQIRKSVPVLLRSKGVEALIIADRSLTKEERSIIVDECIEYGFKVYTLPLVSDWDDQKEISKKIKNFEIHDLLERKPITLDTQLISEYLQEKTILVTGAAGSIGSEIVRQVFLFQPKRIILLDQAETPLHSLSLEIAGKDSAIELIDVVGDVRDYAFMETVFKAYLPDVVYHAAAYKHVPLMEINPAQAVFTNVLGTRNVADLSNQYHVDRFVMVSTDKAVNPSSVMGASKRIAEMYVQAKHFKHQRQNSGRFTRFITTRFGNVLGSNGSVVPLFTKQIQEGGPITITHPEIIRYFMTILEACQLVLEAGSMGKGGEIFIFDMGKPVKIIDLARKMIRLAGFVPEKDIAIKIVGLRPGEKLYEELLNDSAKNLPTHHEKIMIAVESSADFEYVSQQVDVLITTARTGAFEATVSQMKALVPDFKSLNSVYEKLDSTSP
ncbi:polysaccharide biosynthesis protein [Flavobacterium sp.]|uniref:polysaccharide biosynthesis protein n=1 Tax=Flavobacterium sp. TaxID=239 RepID=UPI0022BE0FDA|nr:nucleoside-diphosphate sugar epimerase/dehydratase [Flavobacterium sp.]MCZ8144116.1 nucleoside-diphosphate sugar epimerase/dehydratase [Flavobacterium sp.]MCZ8366263.1 nucleoside-diphosphate sugar epimerase/dehydratase [Flavobacterium sp.]